jgi:hypothetical protein
VPITTAGAAIQLQGSSDGTTWSVLYSTAIKGTNGETITSISSNLTGGSFQQHRLAFAGNGACPIFVSQAQFNVADTGQNKVSRCLNIGAKVRG